MATDKPRITISLDPHMYEVVSRLAQANRQSMSRVVTDCLELARPQLTRMVRILEAARVAPHEARDSIRKSLERAEQVLLPILLEAVEQTDLFAEEVGIEPAELLDEEFEPGRGRLMRAPQAHGAGGQEQASTPRPVTRGVGSPARGKTRARKGGSR